MPTVVLNVYSKAYPAITNRIKASVLDATSPFAVVVSIIDTTAGHPARWWNFPGLPRNNYGFSLDEIDGGGAVVNNLALFSVVPGQIDGMLIRDDEQIQVDVTTGLVGGATGFVFDGTGGKPDYLGWEIVPSELTGRGILVEGVDYSWNATTATFALLQLGDQFNNGAYWNIHFNPILNPAGNSYPTLNDFLINWIDVDTTLDDTYFGKKLIVEPSGVYVEVTLPDISTVVEGRKMMVEVTGTTACSVKFLTFGADVINFLNGSLIAMPNESFSIYKFIHPSTGAEWRVCEAEGNFKTVGESHYNDSIQSGVYNMIFGNGASLSKFQYARLYEWSQNLPGAQRVSYDTHATGNNKYLWSDDDSANPANLDKFLIPDRRNLYLRNNSTGKAGDYQANMIKSTGLTLTMPYVQNFGSGPTFGVTDGLPGGPPGGVTVSGVVIGSGTETRPETNLINQYFKC